MITSTSVHPPLIFSIYSPNLIKEEDIPKAMKYRGGIANLEFVGELIDPEYNISDVRKLEKELKIPDSEPVKVLGKPLTPDEVMAVNKDYDANKVKSIIESVKDVEISEEQKKIMKKAMNTHRNEALKEFHKNNNIRLRKTCVLYTGYVLVDDNDNFYLYDGNGHIHDLISRPKRVNIIYLDFDHIYEDGNSRKKYIYDGSYDMKEIS